jgi:hypothetical protein
MRTATVVGIVLIGLGVLSLACFMSPITCRYRSPISAGYECVQSSWPTPSSHQDHHRDFRR